MTEEDAGAALCPLAEAPGDPVARADRERGIEPMRLEDVIIDRTIRAPDERRPDPRPGRAPVFAADRPPT